MSFPRAKLTRFNEIPASTPSPADYYISVNNGTPGGKIPKSERFHEKSPGGSDNGSAISVSSTPLFRTPTLPKKKKSIFSSLSSKKTKSINLSESHLDIEVLKDKIVECNNKDSYIQDLIEQIEEMKVKLCLLEKQKTELSNEILKCEQTAKELKDEHRIVLEKIYKEHDTEVNLLKSKLEQTETELMEVSREVDTLTKKCKNLASIEVLILDLQIEITQKKQALEELQKLKAELEQRLEKLELEHSKEIEALKNEHKREITDMEYAMLQSVSQMQTLLDKEKITCKNKIESLQRTFEDEKFILSEESNARIKQIEEDCKEANVLAEMQMQEKCKDMEFTWKLKLENQEKESDAILKECQAISEYNIIQCEVEKNTIKSELAMKLIDIEEIQKFNADLMISHKKLELKYEDIEETLRRTNEEIKTSKVFHEAEMEMYNKELQEVTNQKKMYEISIQKSHQTIDTLKKRLLDSDRDVEQLKDELETCELSKLEYEGKCNQLTEELEVVAKLNEDLEVQYGITIKKTEERIQELEKKLLEKVEDYGLQAKNEIVELNEKIAQKDRYIAEVLHQVHDQQKLNTKAQELIATAQLQVEDYDAVNVHKNLEMCRMKSDCVKSQNQVEELQETIEVLQNENKELLEKLDSVQEDNVNLRNNSCNTDEMEGLLKQIMQMQEKTQYCDYYKVKASEYEKEILELEGINKKYIDQSGKYDELLQKYEILELKNAALEKKVSEQETLIGPFREQLEAYEMEHKVLISQKSQAENEARDMGLKYAQLLGHQNQKQKIKHLIDLKAKNLELNENKNEMELKLRSQTRLIEKLKKELSVLTKSPRKSRIPSHDKENIGSPNRTLNSSRVESPGPLRDRN